MTRNSVVKAKRFKHALNDAVKSLESKENIDSLTILI